MIIYVSRRWLRQFCLQYLMCVLLTLIFIDMQCTFGGQKHPYEENIYAEIKGKREGEDKELVTPFVLRVSIRKNIQQLSLMSTCLMVQSWNGARVCGQRVSRALNVCPVWSTCVPCAQRMT